jgi:hypothetical protein
VAAIDAQRVMGYSSQGNMTSTTIVWDHELEERFDKYVVFTEDHWLWIGYIDPDDDYGRLKVDGVPERVHRLAYERWIGPIIGSSSQRMVVDHKCRIKHCVNPEHLRLVTYRVNAENSDSPIGENIRKEACERGHPFTPENTYPVRGGRTWPAGRACRTCRREWMRAYRAKKAADQGSSDAVPASSTSPDTATAHPAAQPTAATSPSRSG